MKRFQFPALLNFHKKEDNKVIDFYRESVSKLVVYKVSKNVYTI
jgi:hypothetical protein